MRYKLINQTISSDTNMFDTVNHPEELDEKTGEVTKEAWTDVTPTTKYFVSIVLTIEDTESKAGSFTEAITVESDNSQTGFHVDADRKKAVDDFMANLNK